MLAELRCIACSDVAEAFEAQKLRKDFSTTLSPLCKFKTDIFELSTYITDYKCWLQGPVDERFKHRSGRGNVKFAHALALIREKESRVVRFDDQPPRSIPFFEEFGLSARELLLSSP